MFVISNHHKMTKKIALLFTFLFLTTIAVAQKKEKIKGSKIVTVWVKEIPSFENIEINDNFEVFLVKSDKPSLEIEADDNLHEIINYEVAGETLRVSSFLVVGLIVLTILYSPGSNNIIISPIIY